MRRSILSVDVKFSVQLKNERAFVVTDDNGTLHRIEKTAQFFVIESLSSIDVVVLILKTWPEKVLSCSEIDWRSPISAKTCLNRGSSTSEAMTGSPD